jgi:hypothetical protein
MSKSGSEIPASRCSRASSARPTFSSMVARSRHSTASVRSLTDVVDGALTAGPFSK